MLPWQKDCILMHEYFTRDKLWNDQDHNNFLALGLAGEAGEVANVQKKIMRGDNLQDYHEQMSNEIADVMMYAYLLSHQLSINIDEACENKCKELRERWPKIWE